MSEKIVSLAAIKLRAGDIASKTGRDRMAVTQDLINAHRDHGVEIHDGEAGTGAANLDFSATQPLPVMETS